MPSAKTIYEAAVKDLGGKDVARTDHPWEFARLKREYAEELHNGAPRSNMLKLADTLEDEARANKIPETPAQTPARK